MKLVLLVTLVRTRSIVSGLHSASNLFSFDLFAYIYIYIQIRGLFFLLIARFVGAVYRWFIKETKDVYFGIVEVLVSGTFSRMRESVHEN